MQVYRVVDLVFQILVAYGTLDLCFPHLQKWQIQTAEVYLPRL